MFADRDGNRSQRLLLLRCIAIGAVITGIIATGSSAIATVGVVTVAVSGDTATITAVATALTGILRFLGLIRRGLLGVFLGARSHGGLLLSSPGLLRAGAPRTVRSADLAVIGAPLALCLGRCANFVNGELWGKPTDLPWGVIFGGTAGDMPRHPSQLYEAFLEGVVLFCILQVLSRKKPLLPQGTFMGVFVMGYGIVRFLVEFVRVPDAQLGYLLGGVITMGQLLSLPLVIAGLALIIFARHRNRPQRIYLDA